MSSQCPLEDPCQASPAQQRSRHSRPFLLSPSVHPTSGCRGHSWNAAAALKTDLQLGREPLQLLAFLSNMEIGHGGEELLASFPLPVGFHTEGVSPQCMLVFRYVCLSCKT